MNKELEGLKLKATPRQVIHAPRGWCLCSIDWSNQESMIAAAWSKDEKMLDIFRQPEYLEDGSPNPRADGHVLNAAYCVAPEKFKQIPEKEWVKYSKNPDNNDGKVALRKIGKILSFGTIYGQSAAAMSKLYKVKEEIAQGWLVKHRRTYPQFYQWRDELALLSEVRGWSVTPSLNRCRWVLESNSKGAESPGLVGVNHAVQGAGADLAKTSAIKVKQWALSNNIDLKIISVIHDEIVVLLKTSKLELDEKCLKKVQVKDGFKYIDAADTKWIVDKEVYRIADNIKKIMEDIETNMLNGILLGRCGEPAIAPWWSKG